MKDTMSGPDIIRWMDTAYRLLLPAAAAGGALSVTESETAPNAGPPRHIHDREDEAFVVLAGEVEFWIEGASRRHGPGEAVFVPRGAAHTFCVRGDRPGRHLTILTPGGFEGFFVEMAARGLRIPQDMPAVAEAAARFGLRFTGPPLGAG